MLNELSVFGVHECGDEEQKIVEEVHVKVVMKYVQIWLSSTNPVSSVGRALDF